MGNKIKLSVVVESVTHSDEKNGKKPWVRMKTDHGIVNGNMSWIPTKNEILNISGIWTVWNGQKQFKFSSVKPEIPIDEKMLLHYVCQIAKGIGGALELKIWEVLGDKWQEIKAGDVRGITDKKIVSILEALEYVRLHKSQVDTSAYLQSKGVSFIDSEKAWDEWKSEAIGKITANCYCLTELEQIGFSKVDNGVRFHFDIADDDTRRIQSGIYYAMKNVMSMDGSTTINYDLLESESINILKSSPELVKNNIVEMIKQGSLKLFFEKNLISLTADYYNELRVWRFAK